MHEEIAVDTGSDVVEAAHADEEPAGDTREAVFEAT